MPATSSWATVRPCAEPRISRGAWPAFRAGQLVKRFADLQRTEGNIHFAGSMTASGWYQWIDGAVESGLRAARDVERKLG